MPVPVDEKQVRVFNEKGHVILWQDVNVCYNTMVFYRGGEEVES